jgi:curved DNA-binding protein CbpA
MTMEGVAGNPWAILGVPFGSSREVARAAYRRLAMSSHPDRNPGDEKAAAARLVVLNAAWAEISNAPKPVRPTSPFAAAFEDLVRESEDFEAALRPGVPERGPDAEAVVHLGFAESLSDRQHTVTARAADGRVRSTTVVIPGGVADGEMVVFRGLGEPGRAGGARGDLRLKVAVEPGTGFELRGLDVHREIKLPVWDANLPCRCRAGAPAISGCRPDPRRRSSAGSSGKGPRRARPGGTTSCWSRSRFRMRSRTRSSRSCSRR